MTERSSIFVRIAASCGLMVPVTSTIGWAVGGLAQPDAFSSSDDDISDLGALTASSAWIYNQAGANLTGLLLIVFAGGLWRVLSPDVAGRVGAGVLGLVGIGVFLDGLLRLDCQGIDTNCENVSWHADAHRLESGFTTAVTILAPLALAFAFRRLPRWRDTWIPSLAAIPVSLLVSIPVSALGDGAATRASTLIWTLWVAFVALQVWRKATQEAPHPDALAASPAARA
jgi:hypothetical protein